MPYFDPKPKTNRSDLYDREEELNELTRLIKISPLILILGLRRTGKTSLLYTALNEIKIPNIIIDSRELPYNKIISPNDFTELLIRNLNKFLKSRRKIANKFINLIKNIESINIMGLSIKFKRNKAASTLIDLLNSLNKLAEEENFKLIIAFDEAQELRRITALRLDKLFAYIYDNLKNITLILTGSQIGLLYKFLRINDPEAPLYGRARNEIFLKNFTNEQSKDFLIKGFKQYNITPPIEFINNAINKLNGNIGWLTLLGYKSISKRSFNSKLINEVINEATKLVRSEFNHFLSLRWQAKNKYLLIMKCLANFDEASWSQIKMSLELNLGKKIDDKNFSILLKNLIDASFITKTINGTYKFTDPILKYAFKY